MESDIHLLIDSSILLACKIRLLMKNHVPASPSRQRSFYNRDDRGKFVQGDCGNFLAFINLRLPRFFVSTPVSPLPARSLGRERHAIQPACRQRPVRRILLRKDPFPFHEPDEQAPRNFLQDHEGVRKGCPLYTSHGGYEVT